VGYLPGCEEALRNESDDPDTHVFISYAGPERDQALRVRTELADRGLHVSMDDAFEPGTSVLVNFGLFLQEPTVVVALITAQYLDRHFTEIEVSSVLANPDGMLVPVLAGPLPEPITERGRGLWSVIRGRSLYRLDNTSESFDLLATAIRSKSRSLAGTDPDRPYAGPHLSGELTLAYDWEDAHLLDAVEAGLLASGFDSVTAIPPAALDPVASRPATVGILWSLGAMNSRDVSQIVLDSAIAGSRLLYVLTQDSPATPPSSRSLRVSTQEVASGGQDTAALHHEGRSTLLRSWVDRALALNGGIPFHILGDKYCASREAARATADNYRLAVSEFPAGSEIRLQTVLSHAASCRFRGRWDQAREILLREPVRGNGRPSSSALAVEADLISLEFELGHVTGIIGRANAHLDKCLSNADWETIIGLHRQLGMMHEEQGSYTNARDHLLVAFLYSRDLLDTPLLEERIPSWDARLALQADCLRELAALEWRAGDPSRARSQLVDTEDLCREISDEQLRRYMLAVVTYQRARVDYTIDRSYEKAKDALGRSYAELQQFDNPLRLATVLEYIVRLEMDFLRNAADQAAVLRPTLEKIQRVRETRRHDYTIARTVGALGDLEYALGSWEAAVGHYERARREFNRLGKQPEAANAARALSRCYARMGDNERALTVLASARDNLHSDQQAVRSEIRAEMARLLHQRLLPSEVDDTIELTGVGEFSLHRWIKASLTSGDRVGQLDDDVVLGVGDDCAVLRFGSEDDFVISTDSTPPALLDASQPESAAYAARFAVVSSLSDVLAMGARPSALLLNLHVRRETPAAWTKALLQHANQEARKLGAHIIGGDLKERSYQSLTTVAVGRSRGGTLLTRNAARPGHQLVITLSGGVDEPFGGLGRRWAHELAPFLAEHERSAIQALIDGNARYQDMGLPLEIMQDVMDAGIAKAAIDTSDGVLACAQLLGEASDVGVELDGAVLNNLVSKDVCVLAQMIGVMPLLFSLNAGHDWEVVFTSPQESADRLSELATAPSGQFQRLAVIGEIVPRASWSEEGVLLRLGGNRAKALLPFFTDEKFVANPYEDRAKEWLEFARDTTRTLSSLADDGSG
jgi:thiamine-monophosphate kinase